MAKPAGYPASPGTRTSPRTTTKTTKLRVRKSNNWEPAETPLVRAKRETKATLRPACRRSQTTIPKSTNLRRSLKSHQNDALFLLLVKRWSKLHQHAGGDERQMGHHRGNWWRQINVFGWQGWQGTRWWIYALIARMPRKKNSTGLTTTCPLMNHHQGMMTAETAGGWNILKETLRRTHVEAPV